VAGKKREPESLGSRVRGRRQALELSQEALARRADIGVMHLSKIERQGAIADPRVSTVAKLAKALGCSIDSLVFGSGE